jgi:hypothetical protein
MAMLTVLLLVSMVNLTLMVPGGPVETRHFGHIPSIVLLAFNGFLTGLGIFSMVLAVSLWLDVSWAPGGTLAAGVAYLLVYALDLGRIFPRSPDQMPRLLAIMEWLGLIMSLPLIVLSVRSLMLSGPGTTGSMAVSAWWWLILFPAAGIVWFATRAAGRKGSGQDA